MLYIRRTTARRVQYGSTIKADAVYLSQYQLLPYNRIEEYFSEQLDNEYFNRDK